MRVADPADISRRLRAEAPRLSAAELGPPPPHLPTIGEVGEVVSDLLKVTSFFLKGGRVGRGRAGGWGPGPASPGTGAAAGGVSSATSWTTSEAAPGTWACQEGGACCTASRSASCASRAEGRAGGRGPGRGPGAGGRAGSRVPGRQGAAGRGPGAGGRMCIYVSVLCACMCCGLCVYMP